MKARNRNILIATLLTCLTGFFIFFINDNNQELGASFGVYVKLQFARYSAIAIGSISLLFAFYLSAKGRRKYIEKLIYIFPGVMNLCLGIFGLFHFFTSDNTIVLHEFLINLLIGILIMTDVFFIRKPVVDFTGFTHI